MEPVTMWLVCGSPGPKLFTLRTATAGSPKFAAKARVRMSAQAFDAP